jgi:predicted porin
MFGATYDFGMVKVHGLALKASGNPTGALRPLDTLDLLAGVTVPVAGGNLLASYINHNDRTARTAPGGGDRDANQWAVGYSYPLSRRTSVYTSYARIQNEHGAAFTVGNATEAGTGNKSFDFGVVHNF